MPEDLLAPLGDEPLPPLASAATVRARGDQRRRRARAALAGASAVVVLLGGVTAVALTGDDDALLPAPLASSEPTPPVPSEGSTTEPPEDDALLDPPDVEQALGGSWEVDRRFDPDFSPVLSGCPETPSPSLLPSGDRYLVGAPGSIGQHVDVHPDRAAAQAGYQQLVALVTTCAEDGKAYRVVDGPRQADRLLAVQAGDGRVRPFSLEQVGRVVVVTMTAFGTEPSVPLADAAAAEVERVFPDVATTGAPTGPSTQPTRSPATPSASPAVPASQLLLTVADAQRADPGSWTREGQDVEGPLLDPCTGGTDYPRADDTRDGAVTILVGRREAGDITVVQTVGRYSSTAAATDAAAGYERAVRSCRDSTSTRNGDRFSRTHEVVSESDVEGVPTAFVRRTSRCESCENSAQRYSYYAVQRSIDVVSVLLVEVGEDGDPTVEVIRPFAREAALRLT